MKKLSYLLGLLLAGTLIFTSCSDDDPVEPQDLTPTLTVNGITDGQTLTVGEEFTLVVTALSNGISGEKLDEFKIYLISNNATTPMEDSTGINSNQFGGSFPYSFLNPFTGILYIEIIDKDNENKIVSFNITVEESTGPISTFTAILMGGQANPNTGSFYSTQDMVYTVNEAVNNQAKIDFVFFWGTNNKYSIGAPNDDQVAIAHEVNGIANWTIKNATLFSTDKIANLTWDDVTNDGLIVSNASDLSASLANELLNGEIYAFETASTSANPSKMGLFKVIQTSGSSGVDRQIEIEVKIQQ